MAKVAGECNPRFENVRRTFEASFDAGEVGAAVAVTIDGRPVVDLWGGSADKEGNRPWNADTIVNVYSTTKGMTAICAHRLVEQGKLDLDAPVKTYWPEMDCEGKGSMPVRYLLCHRSGLAGWKEPIPEGKSLDWDYLCDALARQAPFWEPGTRHGYHAVTYGYLVGELVRRIDGRSLGTYFREEVAQPLGVDFHIGLADEHHGRCADIIQTEMAGALGGRGTGARARGRERQPMDPAAVAMAAKVFRNSPANFGVNAPEWRRAEVPAANGHGTARGLARVYGALACGGEVDGVHVLGPEAIETANTEQVQGPDAVLFGMNTRFGLGFFMTQPAIPFGPNPRAFGHPGAGGSVAFCDPDARLGFAYVMNQMQATMMAGSHGFNLINEVYEALG